MKTKLVLFLFLCSFTAMYSQQLQISGTVISSEDNLPIVGANVLIVGKNAGTTTDFDGNYQLSVNKGDQIAISYIGFTSKTVNITNQKIINVTLSENTATLDEVVVVGYGTQRKKEVTGAVAVISSEAITKLNPTRIEQALQGQVSGVNVTSDSGSPGSSSSIRIRGVSTNGDNSPLILVDGNVIEDLSVINPNDIKTMNVLKDATAGIYGVRAANGVILITTKSGRKNSELKFSLDSYTGFQQTSKKINVLNATEYALITNEAALAGGNSPLFSNYGNLGYGTNWQNEVFSTAPISSTNLSASGGTEKATYSFGVSYLDQDGIVGGGKSNYNRLTARANIQYDLLENLKLNATAIYTHSNKNKLNENALGSVLFNALNMSPTLPVREANGEFSLAEGLGGEVINPIAQMANSYDTDVINKISATFGATYTFLKDFTVSSKFQYNNSTVDIETFKPEVNYGSSKVFNVSTNEFIDNKDSYEDYTWDNYITYEKSFDDVHNVKVLLGTSVFKTTGKYVGLTGRNLVSNNFSDASIDNAGTVTNRYNSEELARNSNTFDTRLLSYFTRVQYNYKQKYLFSGVLRRDGSTRFGPNNRFGFFPSASLGWNITEEDFLQENSWLNSLKLRASYGVIGNDRIADYGYVSTLGGQAIYVRNDEVTDEDLLIGLAEGTLANPDIKWEEQKTANLGFDARLLDNKMNITFDAFSRKTENLLLSPQVSGILGASAPGSGTPVVNAGTVENKGLEFLIGYNDQLSDDFSFNVSYNVTALKNEVLFVASENGFEQGGSFGVSQEPPSRMEAGESIGFFYGYQTDGVFQNQAEIDASPVTSTATSPGDIKFVDQNKDGTIDLEDRVNLGDPIPEFTMGFNIGFNYKNFDFSSSAFASIGNDIVRNYERVQPQVNRINSSLGRWTGEGTSNSIPRVTAGTSPNSLFSDYFVEDGSYLRIQNIQLGYSLNENILEKAGLNKLRFYVSVNNLYTFTNYKGYDPSASSGDPIGAGIDQGFYPVPRTFLLGMNLKF
ncbi:SusC/RagA family TonB-linked outer membrane protein [Flavicella sediminum]|uniref:SusC/RagA family TonB-linked outer membrane protein n=1 Tax=Flavicella sediminum TaxID=2585141 RepID=UPI00111F7041|nr:TonB-dependent receptor [Flavicella sediminum]